MELPGSKRSHDALVGTIYDRADLLHIQGEPVSLMRMDAESVTAKKNPKTGVRHKRTFGKLGMADLIGTAYGVGLAVEVKTGGGKLKPDQRDFRDWWIQGGGKFVVVRNVEDWIALVCDLREQWQDRIVVSVSR